METKWAVGYEMYLHRFTLQILNVVLYYLLVVEQIDSVEDFWESSVKYYQAYRPDT